MTIQIQSSAGQKVETTRLRKIAQTISDASGYRDAELSLLFTDDATICQLNQRWREKDRPTDVLSFPQLDDHGPTAATAVLGDIVISVETAARQAEARDEDLHHELARLLIHGFLHLLGHDHVRGGEQERVMQAEETRLFALVADQLG